MQRTGVHLATLAVATLLLVGVTLMQGSFTERWAPASRDQIEQAARLLEAEFPKRFNDWTEEQELERNRQAHTGFSRSSSIGPVAPRLSLRMKSKRSTSVQ